MKNSSREISSKMTNLRGWLLMTSKKPSHKGNTSKPHWWKLKRRRRSSKKKKNRFRSTTTPRINLNHKQMH